MHSLGVSLVVQKMPSQIKTKKYEIQGMGEEIQAVSSVARACVFSGPPVEQASLFKSWASGLSAHAASSRRHNGRGWQVEF